MARRLLILDGMRKLTAYHFLALAGTAFLGSPLAHSGELSDRFACLKAIHEAERPGIEHEPQGMVVLPQNGRFLVFTEEGAYSVKAERRGCVDFSRSFEIPGTFWECVERVTLPFRGHYELFQVAWTAEHTPQVSSYYHFEDLHHSVMDPLKPGPALPLVTHEHGGLALFHAGPSSSPVVVPHSGEASLYVPDVVAQDSLNSETRSALDRSLLERLRWFKSSLISGTELDRNAWQLQALRQKYLKAFEACRGPLESDEFEQKLQEFRDVPLPPLVGNPEPDPAAGASTAW